MDLKQDKLYMYNVTLLCVPVTLLQLKCNNVFCVTSSCKSLPTIGKYWLLHQNFLWQILWLW